MLSLNFVAKLAAPALLAALVVLPACTINADKNKEGAGRVDIKTPMGNLHVNEQPDIRDVGLALYPGAKPAEKTNSEDKKSANVNLSFPGFDLKVVAAEFHSDDPNDKVVAFYNKELQHYGKIVECHGKWTGGNVEANPGKNDDLSKPVSCHDSGGDESIELKVGTEGNQHIVAVKPDGLGTKFALVYVRIHTGKDDDTI